LGIAYRWRNFISLGLVATGLRRELPLIAGIALRPLKLLSLYYEGSVSGRPSGISHFFGFNAVLFPGAEIKFTTDTDLNLTLGFSLSLGKPGLSSFLTYPPKSKEGLNTEILSLSYHTERKPSILPLSKRYLEIELSQTRSDVLPGFSLFGKRASGSLYELLDLIKKAGETKWIKAILLKITPDFSLTLSQCEELKGELRQFRKSGKKIFIYTPHLNTINFYLATAADKIILHPLGEVFLPGIYIRTMFLANLLKRLGIEVDVERVGKYKSAPEALTEEKLTPQNREQLEAILDDMYEVILAAFAEKGIDREKAESIINQGLFSPAEGKKKGLLDILAYEDQLDSIIKEETAVSGKVTERKFQQIRYYNDDWAEKDKIAIVYINGSIVYGESKTDFLTGEYVTGCRTVVRYLRRIRNDRRVKAVILRIDSPGGSGFASDIIWREIELTKKRKPVYVSMSSLAASGGYYVAANAKEIFALNSTLTGSIGVFGLKVITRGGEEKLGITRETLKRGEKADYFSPDRHFTEEERKLFRQMIEEFYDQFLNKVAEGRRMNKDKVDSLGQGRVWSGKRAKEFGLVDKIGGITEVIEYVKKEVKLKDAEIVHYPPFRRGLPFIF